MKTSSTVAITALSAGLLLAACEQSNNPPPPVNTPSSSSSSSEPAKPADNTAQNKADRNMDNANPTPMDQSQSKDDVRITADIRKALMDDTSLSTDAHNCKIITGKDGVVTLRGVVDTQQEKDAVEAKAKAVTGVNSVVNDLKVKGG